MYIQLPDTPQVEQGLQGLPLTMLDLTGVLLCKSAVNWWVQLPCHIRKPTFHSSPSHFPALTFFTPAILYNSPSLGWWRLIQMTGPQLSTRESLPWSLSLHSDVAGLSWELHTSLGSAASAAANPSASWRPDHSSTCIYCGLLSPPEDESSLSESEFR